jgi:flagellar biosynthesis protein FlhG
MLDQASELRNLVRRAARERRLSAGPVPHLLAVTGGRRGVGVTTVAIHLSMALVDQGLRVVLVDADLCHPDVFSYCRLKERVGVGDILAARRDIHEVLQRGPGGILVVPGDVEPKSNEILTQRAQERLLKQIQSLGRHADVVLIDIGSTTTPILQRFWFAAHDILLVTTPDAASVMDCYATVKTLLGQGADPEAVRLIVNRTDNEQKAEDVFRRLAQSSAHFLEREITWLGAVEGLASTPPQEMSEPRSPSCELSSPPVAINSTSTLGSAMLRMAARLTTDITGRAKSGVA